MTTTSPENEPQLPHWLFPKQPEIKRTRPIQATQTKLPSCESEWGKSISKYRKGVEARHLETVLKAVRNAR